jgi:hypothetical protein
LEKKRKKSVALERGKKTHAKNSNFRSAESEHFQLGGGMNHRMNLADLWKSMRKHLMELDQEVRQLQLLDPQGRRKGVPRIVIEGVNQWGNFSSASGGVNMMGFSRL